VALEWALSTALLGALAARALDAPSPSTRRAPDACGKLGRAPHLGGSAP
jgi:hypothetical protein